MLTQQQFEAACKGLLAVNGASSQGSLILAVLDYNLRGRDVSAGAREKILCGFMQTGGNPVEYVNQAVARYHRERVYVWAGRTCTEQWPAKQPAAL